MTTVHKIDGTSWLYGCHALRTVPVNADSDALKAPIILTRCSYNHSVLNHCLGKANRDKS